MNSLASIEKIVDIQPIQGADRIECARVLGWPSVIKKGAFTIGDTVCWINPDTVVKRAAWNSFLWPKDDQNPEGSPVRLKCAKFRKQLSYGLIVPLMALPEGFEAKEGVDCSDALGVTKYEAPIAFGSAAKADFPWWLRESDEDNILRVPYAFDELRGHLVYATIKLDGSSSKFSLRNGEFQVFSRGQEVFNDGANPFSIAAKEGNFEDKLRIIGRNLAFCCECVGPRLNSNKMGLTSISAAVYDIWDIDNQRYLNYVERVKICEAHDIRVVPLLYAGTMKWRSIDELQNEIDMLKYDNGCPIEGVVLRPQVEKWSHHMKGRLSFKLIGRPFAEKYL